MEYYSATKRKKSCLSDNMDGLKGIMPSEINQKETNTICSLLLWNLKNPKPKQPHPHKKTSS